MNGLSKVAKRYLTEFYDILDAMIKSMTDAPLSDSISHNFIVQMIPHHEAAIEMSKNILQYTTLLPLQELAENIIAEQTKSIGDMRAVLEVCSERKNAECELSLYTRRVNSISQTMFSQMGSACADNRINADFMREMIPHHEGAIRMSRNALCFKICPELSPILDAIIVSQTKGVSEMKHLLGRICD